MISRWQFSALDTWFFRESRPMESIGGSELQSGFPPSPRTTSGAIRHLVGQKHNVNWSKWNKPDEYVDLKSTIGDANSLGKLRFNGPWCSGGSRERNAYGRAKHWVGGHVCTSGLTRMSSISQ